MRAYDGNLGQWTSPDAYAGDVHDPMSQKPYMWNRNNPLEYEDPSGYCAGVLACGGELVAKAAETGAAKAPGIILGGVVRVGSGVLGVIVTVLTPVPLADDTITGYNRAHPSTATSAQTKNERSAENEKAKNNEKPDVDENEHTDKARESTRQKHEEGKARKQRDKKGGEKGDKRREY